ncbi:hypothetical protein [uncultured Megasphaera sp.]|uniref:hypothetical protein n=1 Tax=uncultured Megasphaera sp. TaxID=165188 RepID=UPI0025ECF088|nr:hypothetical protein [uncultured Megasphaera sp.]
MANVPVASGALFCLSKANFSTPATGTFGKGRGAFEPVTSPAAGSALIHQLQSGRAAASIQQDPSAFVLAGPDRT